MAWDWSGQTWSASTAYLPGQYIINPPSSGAVPNVYVATVGGTSGLAPGPVSTSSAIADGSVTWAWVGQWTGSVTDLAPDCSTAPTPEQVTIMSMVYRQMTGPDWGGLQDDASRYLAAHLATLARSRGRGPTTSEAVGPLSRGYSSLLAMGALGQTSYGIEYLRLARLTPAVLGA
jgi:hypothetical protein